ncbi:MAG: lysozyme inhibitor LprI family protein [Micropepsaceae bacterium]
MLKIALMSSAALTAAIALAPDAAAFDCAKASTDIEKIICADPALKAADDEMAAAYKALIAKAQGDQPAMLKASQIAWLKLRDANCGWQEKVEEKAACLMEQTTARTDYFNARPASGPGFGDSPALAPYVSAHGFGKGKCSADVSMFRFPGAAANAGEKILNGWVNDLAASLEADYGSYAEGDLPDGMQCEYAAATTITYASPDLIAMNVSVYMFGGGAHGNSTATSLVLDRKSGKALQFADVFGAAGQKALVARCAEGIKAAKYERFGDSGTKEEVEQLVSNDMTSYADAIAAGVAGFANWLVYEDRAEVYFAPYELGSYAEGDYTCALPKADLAAAAGAKGWIVP